MKTFCTKVKKVVSTIICFVMILGVTNLTSCSLLGSGGSTKKVEEFYEAVVKSQELLDIVADDIYSYWYDCIYKDKYSSIDVAVYLAQEKNKENLEEIELNEPLIRDLYKEARESEFEDEVKEVMSAYSDYYEFVVNVSGSFETYKSGVESYKKALASALKKLSLEI